MRSPLSSVTACSSIEVAVRPEMEGHAMPFVDRADEGSKLRTEHARHGDRLRTDDMDVDVARAQRRRDFKTDEACADDHCLVGLSGLCNQRAAVVERAQIMNMIEVRAGNVEPDRLRAGRKQKRAITPMLAVRELDCRFPGVDPCHARVQSDVDLVLLIEVRGPQQRPLLGCPAGQIILGQVGPIGGQRRIGAQHRDRPGIAFVAKRFGSHISGRATADDHDGFGHGRRSECRPGLPLHSLPRIGNAVADLDTPAGQRVARRRPQRLRRCAG